MGQAGSQTVDGYVSLADSCANALVGLMINNEDEVQGDDHFGEERKADEEHDANATSHGDVGAIGGGDGDVEHFTAISDNDDYDSLFEDSDVEDTVMGDIENHSIASNSDSVAMLSVDVVMEEDDVEDLSLGTDATYDQDEEEEDVPMLSETNIGEPAIEGRDFSMGDHQEDEDDVDDDDDDDDDDEDDDDNEDSDGNAGNVDQHVLAAWNQVGNESQDAKPKMIGNLPLNPPRQRFRKSLFRFTDKVVKELRLILETSSLPFAPPSNALGPLTWQYRLLHLRRHHRRKAVKQILDAFGAMETRLLRKLAAKYISSIETKLRKTVKVIEVERISQRVRKRNSRNRKILREANMQNALEGGVGKSRPKKLKFSEENEVRIIGEEKQEGEDAEEEKEGDKKIKEEENE